MNQHPTSQANSDVSSWVCCKTRILRLGGLLRERLTEPIADLSQNLDIYRKWHAGEAIPECLPY